MRLSIATSSRTAAQQADLNALAERDPALKEILEYLGGCRVTGALGILGEWIPIILSNPLCMFRAPMGAGGLRTKNRDRMYSDNSAYIDSPTAPQAPVGRLGAFRQDPKP